jgi:hypothetical protein
MALQKIQKMNENWDEITYLWNNDVLSKIIRIIELIKNPKKWVGKWCVSLGFKDGVNVLRYLTPKNKLSLIFLNFDFIWRKLV